MRAYQYVRPPVGVVGLFKLAGGPIPQMPPQPPPAPPQLQPPPAPAGQPPAPAVLPASPGIAPLPVAPATPAPAAAPMPSMLPPPSAPVAGVPVNGAAASPADTSLPLESGGPLQIPLGLPNEIGGPDDTPAEEVNREAAVKMANLSPFAQGVYRYILDAKLPTDVARCVIKSASLQFPEECQGLEKVALPRINPQAIGGALKSMWRGGKNLFKKTPAVADDVESAFSHYAPGPVAPAVRPTQSTTRWGLGPKKPAISPTPAPSVTVPPSANAPAGGGAAALDGPLVPPVAPPRQWSWGGLANGTLMTGMVGSQIAQGYQMQQAMRAGEPAPANPQPAPPANAVPDTTVPGSGDTPPALGAIEQPTAPPVPPPSPSQPAPAAPPTAPGAAATPPAPPTFGQGPGLQGAESEFLRPGSTAPVTAEGLSKMSADDAQTFQYQHAELESQFTAKVKQGQATAADVKQMVRSSVINQSLTRGIDPAKLAEQTQAIEAKVMQDGKVSENEIQAVLQANPNLADLAKDPNQAPGIMDWLGSLRGDQIAALAIGVPVAAMGVLGLLTGGNPLSSILMLVLGLAGAAHGSGLFDIMSLFGGKAPGAPPAAAPPTANTPGDTPVAPGGIPPGSEPSPKNAPAAGPTAPPASKSVLSGEVLTGYPALKGYDTNPQTPGIDQNEARQLIEDWLKTTGGAANITEQQLPAIIAQIPPQERQAALSALRSDARTATLRGAFGSLLPAGRRLALLEKLLASPA